MKNQSFSIDIEFDADPNTVFHCIKDILIWWTTDFEGSTANLNDEFVIHHPGAHYSKQRLVENIPGKKIVWLVTEGTLDWLEKDKSEWTNTKMVFELTPQGNKTLLHFTHEGLTPEKDCYSRCCEGWSTVIMRRLYNYVTGAPGN
jgi:transposase InsO family protein